MKIKPIFLILLLALCLRLIGIIKIPLFGDEIDVANQTYFLSKTLHDYKGNFLPTYIDSFSESRAPLLMYTSIPSLLIFGKNALGLRLTPLIFGLLSIYFTYLLIHLITKNKDLSLLSALILAITPWHIHYSQMSFEVTLLLFLTLSATYCYLKDKHYLSIILFSLCFYTYSTANIFIPILAIYLYFYKKPLPLIKTIKITLLTILLLSPIFFNILNGKASNRFKMISIFNSPDQIATLISKRTSFNVNPAIEQLFHNKATLFLTNFSSNYIKALSPNFLFLEGDTNPRHQIPATSLILIVLIIPLIIGLFSHPNKFFMFLFFISPIPSALTIEGGNHATRLFLLLIPLSYLIALGLTKISKKLQYLIFILCAISLIFYFHEYNHYWQENYRSLNGNYDQLFSHLPKDCSRYFISNSNYVSLPFFLYYQNYNPKQFLKEFKSDQEQANIYADMSGFSLNNKIFFINNWHDNGDNFKKINTFAQANDCFLLFQLKEIPGDWNLSANPLDGYKTLYSAKEPNMQLFGQIIQKI